MIGSAIGLLAAGDPLPEVLLGVIGVAVIAYVLTGGADFGGGVWDLLAAGPRAREQRSLVEHAIAPIWEANHIWMIVVVVLLFTGFPEAFAVVAVALHVPITLALVGMVLRGAAFTFRGYGLPAPPERARWGHVFAWASALTPACLGLTLGGISSGAIRVVDGRVTTGFFAGWTTPFALCVGLFSVVLFALLAAVYLTLDADDGSALQDDFRRRAIGAELVAGGVAALTAWRASVDAPLLYSGLLGQAWSIPVQGLTAVAAVTTLGALVRRQWSLARIAVAAQVTLVVLGWALAMRGHLVLPDVHVGAAGLRAAVVRPVLWILAGGSVLLAPALWLLYRVFKSRPGP